MSVLHLIGHYVEESENILGFGLSDFFDPTFLLLQLELLFVEHFPDSPDASLELAEGVALLDADPPPELKEDGSLVEVDRAGLVLDVDGEYLFLLLL